MCDKCSGSVSPSIGSRRRRLWDLPQQCHCPVVGVCFPLNGLRALVDKAVGGRAVADDYEIHLGAVAQCKQRNRLSELMQKDLEIRHAAAIRAFRAAKDDSAVAGLWAEAVRAGDVSGALWAALTHPRCDEALQEAILREMHMLQHQAGAAVRIDAARFGELTKEHGILVRELGKVQERCTRVIAGKSAEIERLGTELTRERADRIAKDARIAGLTQEIARLQALLPDREQVSRLQKRLARLDARQAELEAQNARLRRELGKARRLQNAQDDVAPETPASTPRPDAGAETRAAMELRHKTVLCVGGRNGNVPSYREVIERAGAQFAHHDGGLEDNQNALDASLAAADLVVCQTGCISHNAYWRVKDFCKRTGKQCVFVENPSTSSLARSLRTIAGNMELAG